MSETVSNGNATITQRTAVKLPLAVFIGLLVTVAGAALAFRNTITSTVSASLVPYVPREEWLQKTAAEEREHQREFWYLKTEIVRIETILSRRK